MRTNKTYTQTLDYIKRHGLIANISGYSETEYIVYVGEALYISVVDLVIIKMTYDYDDYNIDLSDSAKKLINYYFGA